MIFSGVAHRCPLRWVVWDSGLGETEALARCDIYGHTAQEAAESWAERFLEDDMEQTTLWVKLYSDWRRRGPTHEFKVSAEQTTVYNAEAISSDLHGYVNL